MSTPHQYTPLRVANSTSSTVFYGPLREGPVDQLCFVLTVDRGQGSEAEIIALILFLVSGLALLEAAVAVEGSVMLSA
jgi:hypothetical protein